VYIGGGGDVINWDGLAICFGECEKGDDLPSSKLTRLSQIRLASPSMTSGSTLVLGPIW
jgi:hypothetical protein